MDESPHWLYSKGRIIEAQQVIKKMARWNQYSSETMRLIPLQPPMARTENEVDEDHFRLVEANANKNTKQEVISDETTRNACLEILSSSRFVAVLIICSFNW